MPMYTFHIRKPSAAPVGLVVLELAHDAAAFQAAGDLLEEHYSSDHVEVWDGERPVVARHREQPIIRPVDLAPTIPAHPGNQARP
jgi:hypothetical protein